MPTLTTAARNALADALVDLLDAGTTDPNGHIDLHITGSPGTKLAVLEMSNPAFGAAAAGVATAAAIADEGSALDTDTVEKAIFYDRDNVEVFRCTAGQAAEELVFNSASFVTGDVISISSFTVTQPAN